MRKRIDCQYHAQPANQRLFGGILAAWSRQNGQPRGHKETSPGHEHWKEKIVQKGIKGVAVDLAPACILLFTGCFMLFVFEPILMYATNMLDFWFDFSIMIGPVVRISITFFLIGIVLIFAIYNVDLMVSKRLLLYKGIILIGFFAFFLLYLQGNWLAGNLPTLTGDKIKWEDYGKRENFVLTSAMVILAVAIIVSIKKRGINRTVFYTAACASVVFVMLSASLVPMVLETYALKAKETFIPTIKNYSTISSNKNFLIFMADTVDSQTFYNLMMEDEEFRGMMEGFTYYPDTLSVYPYTRDSIPNILTGTLNKNEVKFLDYSSNAHNNSPFYEKLTLNDYGINLYSTEIFWKGVRKYNIENSTSIHESFIELTSFVKQELKYIIFKYFPYGLKRLSKIETLDFNTCRMTKLEYAGYTNGNKANYELITTNSILDKQSQNYFQFIHCVGGHSPFNLDKDLKSIEEGTYIQQTEATLTLIKAYLQRLKNNNAYENSAIVILSDHGYQSADEPAEPYFSLSRCNPILFIKGINEKHELLESDRSVSYVELNDAFCDLLDGKQSTELFAELEPGRTRIVLGQRWNTSEHKVEYSSVEYSTTGTAGEVRQFTPTGNVYDSDEWPWW